MAELRYSIAAQSDLAEIEEHGAREFGTDAAEAYARDIMRAPDQLVRYPHSAPARPDYGEGIRSKLVREHLILYQVDAEGVLVLRVLHHSGHVPRHFQK